MKRFECRVLQAVKEMEPEATSLRVREVMAGRYWEAPTFREHLWNVLLGRIPSTGLVSTTLWRLEEEGYLTATMGEPVPERGGRRQRYYALTPKGQDQV